MKFEIYRGESPTWAVIKKLAGDNRARIFGLQIGRIFAGFLFETKEAGLTENDLNLSAEDKALLSKIVKAEISNINTAYALAYHQGQHFFAPTPLPDDNTPPYGKDYTTNQLKALVFKLKLPT